MVTIEEWTTFTNLHAILSNAGQGGSMYQDFKPFTAMEIHSFIALYIFNGLAPAPQIKLKFKPQHIDPINGSDLCFRVFGAGAETRHKAFKAFFGVCDPRQAHPPKHTHPNHKIDRFLAWVQSVSIAAWDMG